MTAIPASRHEAQVWLTTILAVDDTPYHPCITFTYAGRRWTEELARWRWRHETLPASDGATRHRLVAADPATGLHLRVEITAYTAFPVVEWVGYFCNTGAADTPLIEHICTLDLHRPRQTGMVLHHMHGDSCTADSFQPFQQPITPEMDLSLSPQGGRPTNGAWPYFNIAAPAANEGLIAAIGWPGQWAARITASEHALHITGGQQTTHFILHPGEEVRTPLSVLLFYHGDAIDGQNLWRRWMLAHNLPRPGGTLPAPFTAVCMGLQQNEEGERRYIEAFVRAGVALDYWWMDAGWYPCTPDWTQVGTWEPDPERFPHGIRAVSDHAHARGMKLVLWFEPERVRPGTWLAATHPEWLLSCPEGGDLLLNLGDPAARQWLTAHIGHFIAEHGVDLYRQDHNVDPLPYWQAHDEPTRQGITEIRHVEGYLAYWDALRARFPEMLIDTCASGGRRNDLETLRRAVPLLRSDYQFPFAPWSADSPERCLVGNQGHTYGLSSWVPFYGTGLPFNEVEEAKYDYRDPYAVYSFLCPMLGLGIDPDDPRADWPQYRSMLAQWRRAAPFLLGDFFSLTSYSLAEDCWIAWQFHRSDLDEGLLQVFRRGSSLDTAAQFPLRGLSADVPYAVTDLTNGDTREIGGADLLTGLAVELPTPRSAALLVYRRV